MFETTVGLIYFFLCMDLINKLMPCPESRDGDREACDREACDREACDREACDRDAGDSSSRDANCFFQELPSLSLGAVTILDPYQLSSCALSFPRRPPYPFHLRPP